MKKLFFILFISFFIFSFLLSKEHITLFTGKGELIDGKRHGKWISYYNNGDIFKELNYNKGKKEGQYKHYFNNYLIHSGRFENNKEEGKWIYLDKNGFLKRENFYHKGELIKTNIYRNRKLFQTKVFYLDDHYIRSKISSNQIGDIHTITEYKNNKKFRWLKFHERKLVIQNYYKEGERSIEIWYDEEGKEIENFSIDSFEKCNEETEVELWGNCYNIKETTSIHINNQGLTGPIPPNIENLINLEYLDLGGNNLSGKIPSEIGNLKKLRWFRIYDNSFTGEIPKEVCDFINNSDMYNGRLNDFYGSNPYQDHILNGNNLKNTCY